MPAMSTTPQPPRPPVPPQPPGKSSHFLSIALLLLALIVVLGIAGVMVGVHVLTHAVHVNVDQTNGGKKTVSIETPVGSLEVNHGVSEASLGLPIYPGAAAVKDNDSANVNLDIADDAKVRINAGKFETPDSLDKVVAFYQGRIGNDVTKFKVKDEEGKTVFEIKHGNQDKVVALKRDGEKTVIELVHVSGGSQEAN
jgi:hypothetical protein